jgi:hypothetical protein
LAALIEGFIGFQNYRGIAMRKDFKTKLVWRLFILISVIGFSSAGITAQTKASKDWTGIYSFTDSAQSSKRQGSYDVVPMVESFR